MENTKLFIDNFLEFSKPPKLRKQVICPSDIVDYSVNLLKHRLESYHVTVEIIREDRLPYVGADPEQFKEVLLNVILNACEAMKTGGKIVIEEKTLFQGYYPHEVRIEISDNGPGIPESIRDEIFQPFFTTKEEGTGLGLSIATKIIGQHEGSIALSSREGEGGTFIITIPVKEMNLE